MSSPSSAGSTPTQREQPVAAPAANMHQTDSSVASTSTDEACAASSRCLFEITPPPLLGDGGEDGASPMQRGTAEEDRASRASRSGGRRFIPTTTTTTTNVSGIGAPTATAEGPPLSPHQQPLHHHLFPVYLDSRRFSGNHSQSQSRGSFLLAQASGSIECGSHTVCPTDTQDASTDLPFAFLPRPDASVDDGATAATTSAAERRPPFVSGVGSSPPLAAATAATEAVIADPHRSSRGAFTMVCNSTSSSSSSSDRRSHVSNVVSEQASSLVELVTAADAAGRRHGDSNSSGRGGGTTLLLPAGTTLEQLQQPQPQYVSLFPPITTGVASSNPVGHGALPMLSLLLSDVSSGSSSSAGSRAVAGLGAGKRSQQQHGTHRIDPASSDELLLSTLSMSHNALAVPAVDAESRDTRTGPTSSPGSLQPSSQPPGVEVTTSRATTTTAAAASATPPRRPSTGLGGPTNLSFSSQGSGNTSSAAFATSDEAMMSLNHTQTRLSSGSQPVLHLHASASMLALFNPLTPDSAGGQSSREASASSETPNRQRAGVTSSPGNRSSSLGQGSQSTQAMQQFDSAPGSVSTTNSVFNHAVTNTGIMRSTGRLVPEMQPLDLPPLPATTHEPHIMNTGTRGDRNTTRTNNINNTTTNAPNHASDEQRMIFQPATHVSESGGGGGSHTTFPVRPTATDAVSAATHHHRGTSSRLGHASVTDAAVLGTRPHLQYTASSFNAASVSASGANGSGTGQASFSDGAVVFLHSAECSGNASVGSAAGASSATPAEKRLPTLALRVHPGNMSTSSTGGMPHTHNISSGVGGGGVRSAGGFLLRVPGVPEDISGSSTDYIPFSSPSPAGQQSGQSTHNNANTTTTNINHTQNSTHCGVSPPATGASVQGVVGTGGGEAAAEAFDGDCPLPDICSPRPQTAMSDGLFTGSSNMEMAQLWLGASQTGSSAVVSTTVATTATTTTTTTNGTNQSSNIIPQFAPLNPSSQRSIHHNQTAFLSGQQPAATAHGTALSEGLSGGGQIPKSHRLHGPFLQTGVVSGPALSASNASNFKTGGGSGGSVHHHVVSVAISGAAAPAAWVSQSQRASVSPSPLVTSEYAAESGGGRQVRSATSALSPPRFTGQFFSSSNAALRSGGRDDFTASSDREHSRDDRDDNDDEADEDFSARAVESLETATTATTQTNQSANASGSTGAVFQDRSNVTDDSRGSHPSPNGGPGDDGEATAKAAPKAPWMADFALNFDEAQAHRARRGCCGVCGLYGGPLVALLVALLLVVVGINASPFIYFSVIDVPESFNEIILESAPMLQSVFDGVFFRSSRRFDLSLRMVASDSQFEAVDRPRALHALGALAPTADSFFSDWDIPWVRAFYAADFGVWKNLRHFGKKTFIHNKTSFLASQNTATLDSMRLKLAVSSPSNTSSTQEFQSNFPSDLGYPLAPLDLIGNIALAAATFEEQFEALRSLHLPYHANKTLVALFFASTTTVTINIGSIFPPRMPLASPTLGFVSLNVEDLQKDVLSPLLNALLYAAVTDLADETTWSMLVPRQNFSIIAGNDVAIARHGSLVFTPAHEPAGTPTAAQAVRVCNDKLLGGGAVQRCLRSAATSEWAAFREMVNMDREAVFTSFLPRAASWWAATGLLVSHAGFSLSGPLQEIRVIVTCQFSSARYRSFTYIYSGILVFLLVVAVIVITTATRRSTTNIFIVARRELFRLQSARLKISKKSSRNDGAKPVGSNLPPWALPLMAQRRSMQGGFDGPNRGGDDEHSPRTADDLNMTIDVPGVGCGSVQNQLPDFGGEGCEEMAPRPPTQRPPSSFGSGGDPHGAPSATAATMASLSSISLGPLGAPLSAAPDPSTQALGRPSGRGGTFAAGASSSDQLQQQQHDQWEYSDTGVIVSDTTGRSANMSVNDPSHQSTSHVTGAMASLSSTAALAHRQPAPGGRGGWGQGSPSARSVPLAEVELPETTGNLSLHSHVFGGGQSSASASHGTTPAHIRMTPPEPQRRDTGPFSTKIEVGEGDTNPNPARDAPPASAAHHQQTSLLVVFSDAYTIGIRIGRLLFDLHERARDAAKATSTSRPSPTFVLESDLPAPSPSSPTADHRAGSGPTEADIVDEHSLQASFNRRSSRQRSRVSMSMDDGCSGDGSGGESTAAYRRALRFQMQRFTLLLSKLHTLERFGGGAGILSGSVPASFDNGGSGGHRFSFTGGGAGHIPTLTAASLPSRGNARRAASILQGAHKPLEASYLATLFPSIIIQPSPPSLRPPAAGGHDRSKALEVGGRLSVDARAQPPISSEIAGERSPSGPQMGDVEGTCILADMMRRRRRDNGSVLTCASGSDDERESSPRRRGDEAGTSSARVPGDGRSRHHAAAVDGRGHMVTSTHSPFVSLHPQDSRGTDSNRSLILSDSAGTGNGGIGASHSLRNHSPGERSPQHPGLVATASFGTSAPASVQMAMSARLPHFDTLDTEGGNPAAAAGGASGMAAAGTSAAPPRHGSPLSAALQRMLLTEAGFDADHAPVGALCRDVAFLHFDLGSFYASDAESQRVLVDILHIVYLTVDEFRGYVIPATQTMSGPGVVLASFNCLLQCAAPRKCAVLCALMLQSRMDAFLELVARKQRNLSNRLISGVCASPLEEMPIEMPSPALEGLQERCAYVIVVDGTDAALVFDNANLVKMQVLFPGAPLWRPFLISQCLDQLAYLASVARALGIRVVATGDVEANVQAAGVGFILADSVAPPPFQKAQLSTKGKLFGSGGNASPQQQQQGLHATVDSPQRHLPHLPPSPVLGAASHTINSPSLRPPLHSSSAGGAGGGNLHRRSSTSTPVGPTAPTTSQIALAESPPSGPSSTSMVASYSCAAPAAALLDLVPTRPLSLLIGDALQLYARLEQQKKSSPPLTADPLAAVFTSSLLSNASTAAGLEVRGALLGSLNASFQRVASSGIPAAIPTAASVAQGGLVGPTAPSGASPPGGGAPAISTDIPQGTSGGGGGALFNASSTTNLNLVEHLAHVISISHSWQVSEGRIVAQALTQPREVITLFEVAVSDDIVTNGGASGAGRSRRRSHSHSGQPRHHSPTAAAGGLATSSNSNSPPLVGGAGSAGFVPAALHAATSSSSAASLSAGLPPALGGGSGRSRVLPLITVASAIPATFNPPPGLLDGSTLRLSGAAPRTLGAPPHEWSVVVPSIASTAPPASMHSPRGDEDDRSDEHRRQHFDRPPFGAPQQQHHPHGIPTLSTTPIHLPECALQASDSRDSYTTGSQQTNTSNNSTQNFAPRHLTMHSPVSLRTSPVTPALISPTGPPPATGQSRRVSTAPAWVLQPRPCGSGFDALGVLRRGFARMLAGDMADAQAHWRSHRHLFRPGQQRSTAALSSNHSGAGAHSPTSAAAIAAMTGDQRDAFDDESFTNAFDRIIFQLPPSGALRVRAAAGGGASTANNRTNRGLVSDEVTISGSPAVSYADLFEDRVCRHSLRLAEVCEGELARQQQQQQQQQHSLFPVPTAGAGESQSSTSTGALPSSPTRLQPPATPTSGTTPPSSGAPGYRRQLRHPWTLNAASDIIAQKEGGSGAGGALDSAAVVAAADPGPPAGGAQ